MGYKAVYITVYIYIYCIQFYEYIADNITEGRWVALLKVKQTALHMGIWKVMYVDVLFPTRIHHTINEIIIKNLCFNNLFRIIQMDRGKSRQSRLLRYYRLEGWPWSASYDKSCSNAKERFDRYFHTYTHTHLHLCLYIWAERRVRVNICDRTKPCVSAIGFSEQCICLHSPSRHSLT